MEYDEIDVNALTRMTNNKGFIKYTLKEFFDLKLDKKLNIRVFMVEYVLYLYKYYLEYDIKVSIASSGLLVFYHKKKELIFPEIGTSFLIIDQEFYYNIEAILRILEIPHKHNYIIGSCKKLPYPDL